MDIVHKIIAGILTVVMFPFQGLVPPVSPASLSRPFDASAQYAFPPVVETVAVRTGLEPQFLLSGFTWIDAVETDEAGLPNDSRLGSKKSFFADRYLLEGSQRYHLSSAVDPQQDPKQAQQKLAYTITRAAMASAGTPLGTAAQDAIAKGMAARVRIVQAVQNPEFFLLSQDQTWREGVVGTPQVCSEKSREVAFFSAYHDLLVRSAREADDAVGRWAADLKASGKYEDLEHDLLFRYLLSRLRYRFYRDLVGAFVGCLRDPASCQPITEADTLQRSLVVPGLVPIAAAAGLGEPSEGELAFLQNSWGMARVKVDFRLGDDVEDMVKALREFGVGEIQYGKLADGRDFLQYVVPSPETGRQLYVHVQMDQLTGLEYTVTVGPRQAVVLPPGPPLALTPPPPAPPQVPSVLASTIPKNAAYHVVDIVADIAARAPLTLDGQKFFISAKDLAEKVIGKPFILYEKLGESDIVLVRMRVRLPNNYIADYIVDVVGTGRVVAANVVKMPPPVLPPLLTPQPKPPTTPLPTSPESAEYKAVTEGAPNVKPLSPLGRYGLRSLPLAILRYIRGHTVKQMVISGAAAAGGGLVFGVGIELGLVALNRLKERAYNSVYCTVDAIPEIPGGLRMRNCYPDVDTDVVVENHAGVNTFVIENSTVNGKLVLRGLPNLNRIVIERLNQGDRTAYLKELFPKALDVTKNADPLVELEGVGTADVEKGLSLEFYENEWGTLPAFNRLHIPETKSVSIALRNHALATAAPIRNMLQRFSDQKDLEIRIPGRSSEQGLGNPICDPTRAVSPKPTDEVEALLGIERDIMWQEFVDVNEKRTKAGLSPVRFYCEARPSWEKGAVGSW